MMDISAQRTLLTALGIEPRELTKNRVVMTMPVSDNTRQPFGLLHGGASVALAESAASLGAWMNVDQETQMAVGLEINANHIRGKAGGIVTAVATPLHRGRTTMVWEIQILDEQERLICLSRCTIAVIDRPDRQPKEG